jgi:hypothetical protein
MTDKTVTYFFAAALGLGMLYFLTRPAEAATGPPAAPEQPGPVTPQATPQIMTVEYTVR